METTIADIEVFAETLDIAKAAALYQEHGCLVVRGLMKPYIEKIAQEVEGIADTARSLYDQAKEVPGIGWTTPDGTLWIKAPAHYGRDKQIMVLGLRYTTSGAFLSSALDKPLLDLVEAILGLTFTHISWGCPVSPSRVI